MVGPASGWLMLRSLGLTASFEPCGYQMDRSTPTAAAASSEVPIGGLVMTRATLDEVWEVRVRETGNLVGDRIRYAWRMFEKMVGLLNRSSLEDGEGLLLKTYCIHMIGMRFPIDCVYLNNDGKVLKIAPNVPLFALSWSGLPLATHTLELPAGRAGLIHLEKGQTLDFQPSSKAY